MQHCSLVLRNISSIFCFSIRKFLSKIVLRRSKQWRSVRGFIHDMSPSKIMTLSFIIIEPELSLHIEKITLKKTVKKHFLPFCSNIMLAFEHVSKNYVRNSNQNVLNANFIDFFIFTNIYKSLYRIRYLIRYWILYPIQWKNIIWNVEKLHQFRHFFKL